jgi:hypothetical protein
VGEAIWELAGALCIELDEILEDLTEAVRLPNRLADLTPDGDQRRDDDCPEF